MYLLNPTLNNHLIIQTLKGAVYSKNFVLDRTWIGKNIQLSSINSGNLPTKAVSLCLGNLALKINDR